MHRARRYDESKPRDMRRTTVAGDAPTVAQQAVEQGEPLFPRPALAGRGSG